MKKLKSESRSAVIGTVIIILAMVIVFGAVFAWMYSVDLLFLPDFAENVFGLDKDKENTENKNGLSEIVRPDKYLPDSSVGFEVTYDNLKTAFVTDKPAESYYLSAEVSYYSGKEQATRRVDLYRYEDRFRVELYEIGDPDTLETLKICDGESMTITDQKTGIGRTIAVTEGISPENEAGIPTALELIKMVERFPPSEGTDTDSADETGLSSCVIKLIKDAGGNTYYIAFNEPALSIFEEYYISLESGMVSAQTTKVADALTYSYKLVKFSHNSEMFGDMSLYETADGLKAADE